MGKRKWKQTKKRKQSPKTPENQDNDPPTKRIKLTPIPQLTPEKLTNQTTTQTRNNNNKINKNNNKIKRPDKKQHRKRKTPQDIQKTKTTKNIYQETNEPTPDITQMATAEMIQKTYVEYLPGGAKKDRYRKQYIPKINNKQNAKKKTEMAE